MNEPRCIAQLLRNESPRAIDFTITHGKGVRNHYPHQKTESGKKGSDLSEKPEGLEMTVMTLNLVEKQPATMRRIIGKHLAVLAGRRHAIIIIR
ncbi:Phage protein B [Escherichia coli]|uniref:Phage protein B n=1 Tax=Escherichia coli TaxID=562 RepID=A0A2X1MZD0_ECOLX|nr:Phage protein B [Escherichia coli]